VTLDLKVRMEEDFIDIRKKLERAKEKAGAANLKVHNLETLQAALKSALDILDGKPATTFTQGQTEVKTTTWSPIVATPVIVDGVIVEPGFKYVKDAQGVVALVPDDANHIVTQDEPWGTMPPSIALPEIADFAPDLPGAL
jgi:hypothetical protein